MAVYAIPIMQQLHQIFCFTAFEMGKAITSLNHQPQNGVKLRKLKHITVLWVIEVKPISISSSKVS